MKILYICGDIGVPVGGRKGAATHVRETCHALHYFGHEVLLVAANVGDRSQIESGIDVIEVPPPTGKWLGADLRYILLNQRIKHALEHHITNFQPDAIYERNALYQTAGQKWCQRLRLPRILEVNTLLAREQSHRLRAARLADTCERQLWRRERAIIAVSQILKTLMIKTARIDESRMAGFVVSPVAVNPDFFRPDTMPADLSRFGLNGKRIAGYMGTLTVWHGVDLFFDAARILREAGEPVVIAAFGGDPQRADRLRKRAVEENVDSHLRFLGSVPHNDVPSYLAAMDIGLIPDTQDWSSPTKFFELAAMERPVVAACCPAVEEVFGSEEMPGMLFERGNARDMVRCILDTLHNPSLAATRGRAGRRRVLGNYSWSCNIRRIMTLYMRMGARGAELPPADVEGGCADPGEGKG
ncbi:MAG: glycosyltransferase family 4 protein [Candidatus Sumerlaeota bacterium]|nr:glycosyltransferase family 4 protein [Candidatus Sumerlaeota bacterium]